MPEGPTNDIEAPKDPYEGLTLNDPCPIPTDKPQNPKIKNCKCAGCDEFKKRPDEPKAVETVEAAEKTDQTPVPARRVSNVQIYIAAAVVAIIAIAVAVSQRGKGPKAAGNPTATEPAPKDPVPKSKPKPAETFENGFEINGLQVQLDDSWKKHPEHLKIPGKFKEVLRPITAFLTERFQLSLPSKPIEFRYQPKLAEKGVIAQTDAGHVISRLGTIQERHYTLHETSRTQLSYVALPSEGPVYPITVSVIDPATILSQIFSIDHGTTLQGSDMWVFGISNALAEIYQEQHPNETTEKYNELPKAIKEGLERKRLNKECFENPDVLKELNQFGWSTDWVLPHKRDPHVRQLTRHIATVHWKAFLKKPENAEFLKKFYEHVDGLNERTKKACNDERVVMVPNDLTLVIIGMNSFKGGFYKWYMGTKAFMRPSGEEEISIAFDHGPGKNGDHIYTIICGERRKAIMRSTDPRVEPLVSFEIAELVEVPVREDTGKGVKGIPFSRVLKEHSNTTAIKRYNLPADRKFFTDQGKPIRVVQKPKTKPSKAKNKK